MLETVIPLHYQDESFDVYKRICNNNRGAANALWRFAIITFIGMWNDYVNPALFLPKMPTLAVGLQQMIEDLRNKHEYPHIFSGVVIALIPVMAVYIGFSKIIMTNTSVGGLKG